MFFCSTFVPLLFYFVHFCSTFVPLLFHFFVSFWFSMVFLKFSSFFVGQFLFHFCSSFVPLLFHVVHFCSTFVPLFRQTGQNLKYMKGPTCGAATSRPETDIGELGNPVDGHFQLNTFLHHLVPRAKWCKNLFSGIALFPVVCELEPPTHTRMRIRNVGAIWGFVC